MLTHARLGARRYTAALSYNPFDHIFYSNRSACYAGLEDEKSYVRALSDAERCVELAPSFAKGYSRLATALFGLGRYPEAQRAAERGVDLDPGSAVLMTTLAEAKIETAETPAVQAQMHRLRTERARDEKMKSMLSGLNLGSGVKMFTPGMGGDGLEGLFNGGGMGGMGGGGLQAPAKSDGQLRAMARAFANATESAQPDGGDM